MGIEKTTYFGPYVVVENATKDGEFSWEDFDGKDDEWLDKMCRLSDDTISGFPKDKRILIPNHNDVGIRIDEVAGVWDVDDIQFLDDTNFNIRYGRYIEYLENLGYEISFKKGIISYWR